MAKLELGNLCLTLLFDSLVTACLAEGFSIVVNIVKTCLVKNLSIVGETMYNLPIAESVWMLVSTL